MRLLTRWALALCVLALFTAPTVQARPHQWLQKVPDRFVLQALCVHDGWHWKRIWPGHVQRKHDMWLEGHRWYRHTWNVPDTIRGGRGEAAWHNDGSPYYNGMQFHPNTWHRAGGHPSKLVWATPAEQVYRAWKITRFGRSWGEWPWTGRACGLL